MGVRILRCDSRESSTTICVLYCSTTDWAFGPLFYDEENHDAEERLELFLEWLRQFGSDPRQYTDSELESKYTDWRMQEAEQWKTKEEVQEED